MNKLQSTLFRGDSRLEKALVSDPHHLTPGTRGEFVSKIQYAVLVLQGGAIGPGELRGQVYGPETARAVLEYKKRRKIINRTYQTAEDNIVGKMTIRSLDLEMVAYEQRERLKL